jgi:hypothetical protein
MIAALRVASHHRIEQFCPKRVTGSQSSFMGLLVAASAGLATQARIAPTWWQTGTPVSMLRRPLATGRKSPRNSGNEMIAELAVEGLAALLRGFFFVDSALAGERLLNSSPEIV